MTTLYLNNNGDKWIVVDQNYSRAPMDFMLVLEDGTVKKRRADYYAQFGNFATIEFRISGKRYGGFFDSFAKIDGLLVLRRYSKRLNKAECELFQRVLSSGGTVSELLEYGKIDHNRIIDTTEVLTDKDLESLGAYK